MAGWSLTLDRSEVSHNHARNNVVREAVARSVPDLVHYLLNASLVGQRWDIDWDISFSLKAYLLDWKNTYISCSYR